MLRNYSPILILIATHCWPIIYLFIQDEIVPPVSFLHLMRFNISEWPYILVGTICAIINGFASPGFSFVYAGVVGVGAHLCSCIT